jgi:hypothetical protein
VGFALLEHAAQQRSTRDAQTPARKPDPEGRPMILSKRVALAIAGFAAAAVVGTAGVAAATAPDPSGAPAPSSPGASAPDAGTGAPGRADERHGDERHGKLKHRALGRGLHGEFVVKGEDGTYVTLVSVRGEVTAVSATSVTFKAEDGFTATYVVNSETRVRGHDVDKIADVKVGDKGGAVGTKSGSTLTARAVLVRK